MISKVKDVMTMTYEEKITLIVNAIKEALKLYGPAKLKLFYDDKLLSNFSSFTEFYDCLHQLEKDGQIKIIKNTGSWYYIQVFDKFYTQSQLSVQSSLPQADKIVYEITYSPDRKILLNKKKLIAKPDFDSENDAVFQYLFDNANTRHSIKEIENEINRKITKSLHKIVENLGFTGKYRQVFFDVSQNSILFNNPITKAMLEQIGIDKI